MTVRWITDRLGTSPWTSELANSGINIVDVRLLRDASGNSGDLIRKKISEAAQHLSEDRTVVICCDHGVSRSNGIAAAVLSKSMGISLDESLLLVINKTKETGIKVDFVANIREALNEQCPPALSGSPLILGGHGIIGASIKSMMNSSCSVVEENQDHFLLDNAVLLDAAMEKNNANQILFFWRPERLDTNFAVGQLITFLRNALDVCRVRKASLIFLSGHQVFGGHKALEPTFFFEEDDPLPLGAAGEGQYLAETLIAHYADRHDVSTLIVRAPYIYGSHDKRPGFVNTTIYKALNSDEIITHHFLNGAPFIDIVHVKDMTYAIQLAIKTRLTGILHVSSGKPIPTNSLAHLIVRLAKSESHIKTVEVPSECTMGQLGSNIATPVLKWQATIELENGLSEALNDIRQSRSKEHK